MKSRNTLVNTKVANTLVSCNLISQERKKNNYM